MMTVAARSPAEEHRQWINTAAICVDVSYISIATCIRSRIQSKGVVTVVRVLEWKIWFFTANANAARASIDLCYFLPHPG
jgi:hypothetical protein